MHFVFSSLSGRCPDRFLSLLTLATRQGRLRADFFNEPSREHPEISRTALLFAGRFIRSFVTVVAAITGLPVVAIAAPITVNSIQTSVFDTGVTTTRTGLTGGVSAPNGPYTVKYDGIELRLNSFTLADANVGVPVHSGYAVARRNTAGESGNAAAGTSSNPPQVNAWNAVVSGGGTNTQTVRGQYFNTLDALYTSQNLWTGTENLMVNADGNVGNARSDIERVDYIFTALTATAFNGFLAFDRGTPSSSGANGAFKAAAITGFDGSGNPIFVGSAVASVAANSYGNGLLYTPVRYDVIEKAYTGPPLGSYSIELDKMRNDNIGPQGISGVYVPFSDLVSVGTTVYGYAVFGADVTGVGAQLNDWTNTTFFPTNSPISNDLDYVASGAMLYAVPEPSTWVMGAAGIACAGWGAWRRRKLA